MGCQPCVIGLKFGVLVGVGSCRGGSYGLVCGIFGGGDALTELFVLRAGLIEQCLCFGSCACFCRPAAFGYSRGWCCPLFFLRGLDFVEQIGMVVDGVARA